MKHYSRLLLLLPAMLLISALTFAQAAKKSYTFHGVVEAVDKSGKNLKINGEKVEGWMDAMTMNYKVDDPSVLDKAKPGDQITATVYDGDYVLHKVQLGGLKLGNKTTK